jgi:hypothetical protein
MIDHPGGMNMPRNGSKIISLVLLLLATTYLFMECSRPRVGVKIAPEPCDLNGDGECDQRDFELFRKALGLCLDGAYYNRLADADHDGCVSETDEQELFPVIPFYVDVKPDTCPNRLDLSSDVFLPVAVLGTSAHDVADIDPRSVILEGEPSIRRKIEDVAAPPDNSEKCATRGADGIADLTLEFDAEAIVAALDSVKIGDVVVLTLEANLRDGTPIEGKDVIQIISGDEEALADTAAGISPYTLFQSFNPFNPSTEIRFEVPGRELCRVEDFQHARKRNLHLAKASIKRAVTVFVGMGRIGMACQLPAGISISDSNRHIYEREEDDSGSLGHIPEVIGTCTIVTPSLSCPLPSL